MTVYLKGQALCRRPLSFSQLPFGGFSTSVLAPWGLFSSLGATLEDHGRSRKDTRGSRTSFSISGTYFNSLLGTEHVNFCSGLFSRHLLHRCLSRNLDARGSWKHAFVYQVKQKQLSTEVVFVIWESMDFRTGSGSTFKGRWG